MSRIGNFIDRARQLLGRNKAPSKTTTKQQKPATPPEKPASQHQPASTGTQSEISEQAKQAAQPVRESIQSTAGSSSEQVQPSSNPEAGNAASTKSESGAYTPRRGRVPWEKSPSKGRSR